MSAIVKSLHSGQKASLETALTWAVSAPKAWSGSPG